jgi:colanic acid/amylovoran biosynthesis glycosyltransferase
VWCTRRLAGPGYSAAGHHPYPCPLWQRATSVARLAAHFAEVPYSFTAHAKDIFHDSVDPEDLRRKLRDAATVVTVSDYNVAYLRQQFGHDAGKVRRIYNGMDLA